MIQTNWPYSITLLLLILSGVLCAVTALYMWRSRATRGSGPMVMLLLAMTVWTLGCAARMGSIEKSDQIFWNNFQFFGIVLFPIYWLKLVLEHTNQEKRFSRRLQWLLWIEPVLVLVLIWTNDLHHLIWKIDFSPKQDNIQYLVFTPNWGFWLHIAYSYFLHLGVFSLLITYLHSAAPGFRKQAYTILVVAGILFVTNVIDVFFPHILPWTDLTPITFSLVALGLSWGLHRYWLFDLVSVGRSAAFDSLKDAVLVFDLNDRLIDLNEAAVQLLQRPLAEGISRPAGEILAPFAELHRCYLVKGEEEISGETFLNAREKERRYFDFRISRLSSSTDIGKGRLVMLHETTARHQAENDLREREDRLRLTLEQMPAILWVTDPNLHIVSLAGKALTDLGTQPEQFIGASLAEFIAGYPEVETVLEIHNQALQGEAGPFEVVYNQRAYQAYVEPWFNEQHQVMGVRGIAIDMTEQQQAEAELRAGEERLHQMVSNSPSPIFSVDRQGRIQTWNQACEQVFQYGQDLLGQHYSQILADPEQQAQLDQLVAEVFENGSTLTEEAPFRSQAGASLFMTVRLYPLCNSNGKVEACIFSNSDVTSLKQAEDVLRRQLEDLSLLYAVATACVDAVAEDNLIGRVTRLVGPHLGAEHYGVLLLGADQKTLTWHPSYVAPPESIESNHPAAISASLGVPIFPAAEELGAYALLPGTLSTLSVPVRLGDQTLGVLHIESSRPQAFNEADIPVLEVLAGQLAVAMDRLRVEAALRHRAEELIAITGVGREISSHLNREDVLNSIVRHAALLSNSDASGVYVFKDDGRLYLETAYGVKDDFFRLLQADGVPINGSAVGQAVHLRQAVQIPDLTKDPSYRLKFLAEMEDIHSVLALPLLHGDEVLGGIVVWRREPRPFSHQEEVFLNALAQQSVNAIQNSLLYEETIHRLEEVSLLSRVIGVTAAATEPVEAINLVCYELVRFFNVQQAAFGLVDPDGKSATVVAEYVTLEGKSMLGAMVPINDDPRLVALLEQDWPLYTPDVRREPALALLQSQFELFNIVSIVVAPLRTSDRWYGAIGIEANYPREYSQSDLELIQNVSRQVAQALDRLQLFNSAKAHAEQLALLATLSGDLARNLTYTEVLKGIGQSALQLSHADRAALYIRQPVDGKVEYAWSQGLSQCYLEALSGRMHDNLGFTDLPDRTLQPRIVEDVGLLAPDDALLRDVEQEGIQSFSLWPVVYEGEIQAIFACYYNAPHRLSPEEQEVMLTFSRQASVLLENARRFDETRRQAKQQEALNAIIAAAVEKTDLEDLLQEVLDQTMRALNVARGGIWASGKVILHDLPVDAIMPKMMPHAVMKFFRMGALPVNDWSKTSTDHPLYPVHEFVKDFNVKASMTAPIIAGGEFKGGITLVESEPRYWREDEIALMEAMGRQVGSAMERLNLLSITQAHAEQLQQIMDTVPDGVVLLNAQQEIALANLAAKEQLAYLAPRHSGPLTHLARQPITPLLKENRPWQDIVGASPESRIFEIAARPLGTAAPGEGWVLVLRDVTQERQNQKHNQMQERLATVGQLAAGIAHDFNNIMAAIVVYADLLTLDPNLQPVSKDRLSIIQQQVDRATSLIRQILDFSRRSVMEHSTLDLLPFIKELDKLLERVLPENIRLELTFQRGTYLVRADPTRLQQVFMNLAVNARDAMPRGGILHFSLQRLTLAPGEQPPLPELTPGEWVVVDVKDNGVGIGEEHLPNIFNPFYTTKAHGEGTGLGLAQVYGIVKAHGGSIQVESQLNVGTTFKIYLPAEVKPVGKKPQKDSEPLPVGAGELILLVEDDNVARDALREMLITQNYQVVTATNGKEALVTYRTQPDKIAAVISDVVMPEMGGMELYEALSERNAKLKILMITGHPLDDKDQTYLEDGRVQWLQKPFDVRTFAHALQKLLHPDRRGRRVKAA